MHHLATLYFRSSFTGTISVYVRPHCLACGKLGCDPENAQIVAQNMVNGIYSNQVMVTVTQDPC